MELHFYIANSVKNGSFFITGKKTKVDEDLFRNLIKTKVELLTKEKPEMFNDVHNDAIDHIIEKRNSLIILDVCFQVRKGKQSKAKTS
jgi:hypothetical protein